MGGAIEVFVRSEGWSGPDDAPRPIPSNDSPLPNNVQRAKYTAIVPLLGAEMASAAQSADHPWRAYLERILGNARSSPSDTWIFPYAIDAGSTDNTHLGDLLGGIQRIAQSNPSDGDATSEMRCRDLAQGIAQAMRPEEARRLTVFISHTKKAAPGAEEDTASLIATVRNIIGETRLQHFFDASDLQPGEEWAAELRAKAASSALLAIRTDLYPSRKWCQSEVLTAKRAGMPVLIVDALGHAEERGSFLMDHVPRVPVRPLGDGAWSRRDVFRALNLLVDECLKRGLWEAQFRLASGTHGNAVSWWAPHAPEPLTFVRWLLDALQQGALPREGEPIRVLHPDPPLGQDEVVVLQEMVQLAGHSGVLDVMTPRMLAARGG